MRHTIVFTLLAAPALLSAQTSATVSPGMNHAQVVAALGEPVNSRTAKEYTYLFYQNSCGRECGMNDLVILLRDSVVDAIFRSPSRHYTGTSSSPEETTPVAARRRAEPATAVKPPTVKPVTTVAKPAPTTAAQPAATVVAKPAAAVVAKPTVPIVTKPAPTTAAKPVPNVETVPAKTEPKPAVVVAPAAAPPEVRGTKTKVEVKGTNREVVVPGTKVDVVVPPTKMAPGAANDTRPSIPLTQSIRDDAPPPAAPKTPTS